MPARMRNTSQRSGGFARRPLILEHPATLLVLFPPLCRRPMLRLTRSATRWSALLLLGSLLAASVCAQSSIKSPLVARESSAQLSYKILQLADLHFTGDPTFPCLTIPATLAKDDSPCTEALTTKFMNELLDTERPDFVVFTGDNVNTFVEDKHQKAVDAFTQGVEDRKIPYAVVFGNHDDENGFTREDIMEMVAKKNYSYAERGPTTVDGVGNYQLSVQAPASGAWGQAGSSVLEMYFLDSGTYLNTTKYPNVTSQYDWIKPSQVEYYRELSLAAQKKASSSSSAEQTPNPALMFFHIPLQEYKYSALEANSTNGEMNEPVSSSDVPSELFGALVERNEVKATFVGHDHVNEYCHKRQGIQLCYGGGTGFGVAYGAANFTRRARVIEWSVNMQNERTIRSWKRMFGQLEQRYEEEVLFTQVAADSSEVTTPDKAGDNSTASDAPSLSRGGLISLLLVVVSFAAWV